MLSTRWFVAAALLALASPWVLAQGGASAPTAFPTDLLDADVAVSAITAPRTFDSYYAYCNIGPSPWRETNTAVSPQPGSTAYGSHAGHSLPASAPPASSSKPAGKSMPSMHHH